MTLTFKERAYDDYVLSGGSSDECFANRDSGNCGKECSIFGSKEKCFDGLSEEEIKEIKEELESI